jgi:Uroporphyrinogen decarboxylase (URO-D)
MTSRERFLKTVNHQIPDRMVVDFGSTSVTGIHVRAVENLRRYYGLAYRPVKVTDPLQMLGEVDNELAEILGSDVTGARGKNSNFGFYNHGPYKEFTTPWGQNVLVPEGFNTTEEPNGDLQLYPEGDLSSRPSGRMPKAAFFFDAIIRQPSFDENTLSPEDNLEEYGKVSESDLEYWRETTRLAHASGKAVVASLGGTALGDIAHIPGIKLKNPRGIRDITEWYMSILIRPDFVRTLFERQTDIALENLSRLHEVICDNIDVLYICGTDFGTQESTFCSPEQFDELWLPQYKRINGWVHDHTSWKTFKHSCGAVEPFISRFIDAGFDILNPVQINARGMDPATLKQTYGKEIVFWGGGIDTQQTLPFSTPDKIREEVLRLCGIFGADGGYVFNTVHNIQANVPVENIVAVIDAVKEFNGQPFSTD